MTTYLIPLKTATAQTFSVTLGGFNYGMRLTWLWMPDAGNWLLDISDQDGVPLVQGIPLVTGADLLAQYAYLGIGGFGGGGKLFVGAGAGDMTTIPNYDNLGETIFLWWSPR